MQQLYSAGKHRNQKVIAVFVGGKDIPSEAQCDMVLTMDPEIEPPVMVVPFGGVPSDEIWDDDVAGEMIVSTTPAYAEEGFFYRCTRIRDFLVIKVLVQRYFHYEPCATQSHDSEWYIALN